MLDWTTITRKMLEIAGENPGVQLQFLMQRLEACPGAKPCISAAVRDMRRWQAEQEQAMEAERARRARTAQIVNLPQK